MRRTLGTAVFAGMLGVTMFGIYLTPVFFYVIRRFDVHLRGTEHAFGPKQQPSEPPKEATA